MYIRIFIEKELFNNGPDDKKLDMKPSYPFVPTLRVGYPPTNANTRESGSLTLVVKGTNNNCALFLIARSAMIDTISNSRAVVDFVLINLIALEESLGQGHFDGLLNLLVQRSRSRLWVVGLGE